MDILQSWRNEQISAKEYNFDFSFSIGFCSGWRITEYQHSRKRGHWPKSYDSFL